VGSKVRFEDEKKDMAVNCSEYDKIIFIFKDGAYKVVPVMDKLFVGDNLLFMGVVSKKLIFNVIYRSGSENRSYVKRFKMPTFINNREYRLFPEHKRSVIQLLTVGEKDIRARVSFVPSARARYNSEEIEFNEYLLKHATAKGKRIGNRVVRRVSNQTGKARKKMPFLAALPGMDKKTQTD
jgi:topoisomerase-4 subunit A